MAARHDDRAGGGEHTPDAAADRDLGAGDLSGGGTAHLAHAPPAIHPGMHVREAAAIRYGLKNLGFAPRGEAGRLITNGMSRSAMRFPLAARDVVWNRCELSRSARDLAKVGNPPIWAVRRGCREINLLGTQDWNFTLGQSQDALPKALPYRHRRHTLPMMSRRTLPSLYGALRPVRLPDLP